ncbi:MAG: hypothetical protein SFY32_15545 [Bacteroidota bacterium]|nr:hypothetical protein [Bacteroidota bacterium]
MKKIILNTALILACVGYITTSCTRKSSDPTPATTASASTDDETAQVQNAGDQNNASTQIDAAMNDAGNALAGSSGARIDDAIQTSGCTVVTSTNFTSTVNGASKSVTITYDRSVCEKKVRSGTIVLTLTNGAKFSDVGATWTVSFSGYTMRRVDRRGNQDTAYVEINGLHTVTNVNGGFVRVNMSLNPSPLVIHKVESNNMSLTFPNGKTRNWNVARQITWDKDYTQTITGFGTQGGFSDVVTWGTNRFGDTFFTRISTPIISKWACAYFPSQGQRIHQVTSAANGKQLTVTESILADADGCAGGYAISFVGFNGQTRSKTVNW